VLPQERAGFGGFLALLPPQAAPAYIARIRIRIVGGLCVSRVPQFSKRGGLTDVVVTAGRWWVSDHRTPGVIVGAKVKGMILRMARWPRPGLSGVEQQPTVQSRLRALRNAGSDASRCSRLGRERVLASAGAATPRSERGR